MALARTATVAFGILTGKLMKSTTIREQRVNMASCVLANRLSFRPQQLIVAKMRTCEVVA